MNDREDHLVVFNSILFIFIFTSLQTFFKYITSFCIISIIYEKIKYL